MEVDNIQKSEVSLNYFDLVENKINSLNDREKISSLEKSALVSGLISAGILIPDGLFNAYNYNVLLTISRGLSHIKNLFIDTALYGICLTKENEHKSVLYAYEYANKAIKVTKDGFSDAAGGVTWRIFACASLGLGIAALGLRIHQRMNEVPSIEPSKVQELPL